MRPITVSVGPLAAASAIVSASTPPAGQLLLGNTPTGGNNTYAYRANCTLVAGVLTVTSVAFGVVGAGPLNGSGLAPGSSIIGPGPTANTWIVYPTQTIAGGQNYWGGQVVTLDAARQITITNTEAAGKTFTVVGTDAAGNAISETLATNGAALTTQQNFLTITSITISANAAASVSVNTAATATSAWVMFDPYASGGNISKQAIVTGVANYTVQVSYDDPNAPGGLPPGGMGWTNDTDPTFVGATTSLSGSWPYTPLWARVLLNSGAGSVRATFIQPGNLGR